MNARRWIPATAAVVALAVCADTINAGGGSAVTIAGSQRATYATAVVAFSVAASATDVCYLPGSASKTVRVNQVIVTGTQQNSGPEQIVLLKRSSADTGGTCATSTPVSYDSTQAAATTTAASCTANPALGALVGNMTSYQVVIPSGTSTNVGSPPLVYSWESHVGAGIEPVLRGTSEMVAVNLNGATLNGGVFACSWEWTEE